MAYKYFHNFIILLIISTWPLFSMEKEINKKSHLELEVKRNHKIIPSLFKLARNAYYIKFSHINNVDKKKELSDIPELIKDQLFPENFKDLFIIYLHLINEKLNSEQFLSCFSEENKNKIVHYLPISQVIPPTYDNENKLYKIETYDPKDNSEVILVDASGDRIQSISLNEYGYIISVAPEDLIKIWHIKSPQPLITIKTKDLLTSEEIEADKKYLKDIYGEIAEEDIGSFELKTAKFSNDLNYLYIRALSNIFILKCDLQNKTFERIVLDKCPENSYTESVKFYPPHYVTCTYSSSIRILDLNLSGKCISKINLPDPEYYYIRDADISPDGNYIVSGESLIFFPKEDSYTANNIIRIWDLDGSLIYSLDNDQEVGIDQMKFSPTGKYIASVDCGRIEDVKKPCINIYEFKDKILNHFCCLALDIKNVYSVEIEFTPNENFLFILVTDLENKKTLKVLDLGEGKNIYSL